MPGEGPFGGLRRPGAADAPTDSHALTAAVEVMRGDARAWTTGRPQRGDAGSVGVDRAGSAGRYLTDGINLYRYLGLIADGNLHGLEDCRTLEVALLTNGDLDRLSLHRVIAGEYE